MIASIDRVVAAFALLVAMPMCFAALVMRTFGLQVRPGNPQCEECGGFRHVHHAATCSRSDEDDDRKGG